MAIQIKLKNSVVQDSTPSTSDLPAVGEIALNANINSIGGFMRASDNSIVKIFGPGSLSTPTATTTVSGISELATNSETTTGTATNRVVTPAGLNAVTVAERTTSNTNYVAKAGSTLTGVLTMPNGSNSAPAINFGDSDSGIFGGTNTVSLAAGGTTRLTADTGVSVVGTLAVTGAITSTSDLTIADKIIHSGDTNTAIRFPAADTVSVETNASERARVDSTGRLLVGTSTARTNFFNLASTHTPRLQIESTNDDNGRAALGLVYGKTNASGPYIVMAKHRSNTVGDNTVVQSGDETGIIAFQGSDGSQFVDAARIQGFVDGTPGSDDMPGRLEFSTTADGAATPTTRLTIDSTGKATFTGNLTISNTDPEILLQDTNNNDDFTIRNHNGVFTVRDATNGADRLTIASDGTTTFASNVDFSAGVDVTGAITGTGDVTITKASPVLRLADTTDPQSADGSIGKIEFFGNDGSSGGADVRSYIQTISTNAAGNAHAFIIGLGESNNAATEKLRLTGSGQLGVGASTVDRHFHVEGTDNVMGKFQSNQSLCLIEFEDTDTTSGNRPSVGADANNLIFFTGGTTSGGFDSSGRFGVGTLSMGTFNQNADDIVVSGSGNAGITINTPNSNTGRIAFGDPEDNNVGQILYNHSTDDLTITAADNIILEGDAVLIGTTTEGHSSADDLTINNSGHGGITIRTGTTSNGAIFFSDATSGAAEYDGYVQYNHGTNPFLQFGVAQDTRMIIDSSGRVMIGVNDTTHASANADDLCVGNNDSSSEHGITIGSNVAGGIRFADSASGSAGLIEYSHSADQLTFVAATNPVARINSSGIKLESSKGIQFHNYGTGTNVSSNTLDDYEEGSLTWATHNTSNGWPTDFSIGNQNNSYTKIGNLVTLKGGFTIGNASGTVAQGNYFDFDDSSLPFTVINRGAGTETVQTIGRFWIYQVLGGNVNASGDVILVHGGYLRFFVTFTTSPNRTNTGGITYFINYTSAQ